MNACDEANQPARPLSIVSLVLAVAPAACTPGTDSAGLANGASSIPLTSFSNLSDGQVPHSGCPAYAKVSYSGTRAFNRITHGSTSWPGECDETAFRNGPKQEISIMGLWGGQIKSAVRERNSLPMLERIQGRTLSNGQPLPDIFIGGAFNQTVNVDFPCEAVTKRLIEDKMYVTRACSYRERTFGGETLTAFDAKWAQDPYDPDSWLIIDYSPSAKFAANPAIHISTWSAVTLEFLRAPPTETRRSLSQN